ncbi:hypothetical protein ACVWZZ_007698 [Bradyrhizobium sp. LM6.10]
MTPYDFKDPDVRRRRFRPIPVRMLVPNVSSRCWRSAPA